MWGQVSMPAKTPRVMKPWGLNSPVEASGRWCPYDKDGCACQYADVDAASHIDSNDASMDGSIGLLQDALRSRSMCAKPLAPPNYSEWTPDYTSEDKESDNINATKCTSSRFQPIYKWSPKFDMACSEARQNEVWAKPGVIIYITC